MLDLAATLRWWMAGPEAKALAKASGDYWARPEDWLGQATDQLDIATCTSEALRAHAADRQIARLPGEPEDLWRKRVLHAVTVARESGSRAGLEAILDAYGVLGYSILERQPGVDWDIIEVRLDPDQLNGATTTLLDRIFHEWGRVCRRYVVTHITEAPTYLIGSEVTEMTYNGVAT